MLKKLLTGCLTIAAAAALALPAMAADMSGKVGGRAVADLVSKSSSPAEGKGASYTDMFAQGRIDYTLTAKEGDWTATGKVELRSPYTGDAASNVTVLQKYAKFENDAVSFSLGTQWWGFVYLTPYVGISDSHDRMCYGCLNLRDDRLIVGIKQVGLQLYYSTRNTDTSDSTSDGLAKTEFGLQYDGTFGDVTVAAAYISQAYAAIENVDSAKGTTEDGRANSQLALAVRYAIQEGMFVEFDYEANTSKAGTSGAKTSTTNKMGLAFAMALSDAQGFAVAYDQQTDNAGTDGAKDYNTTLLTFIFDQQLAGQHLYVGYNSQAKDKLYGTTIKSDNSSTIALGARVNF